MTPAFVLAWLAIVGLTDAAFLAAMAASRGWRSARGPGRGAAPRRRGRLDPPKRHIPARELEAFLAGRALDRTQRAPERLEAAGLLLKRAPKIGGDILAGLASSAGEAPLFRCSVLALLAEHGSGAGVPLFLRSLRSSDLRIAVAAECGLRAVASRQGQEASVFRGLVRSIRACRTPWALKMQLRILASLALRHPETARSHGVGEALQRVIRTRPLDTEYAEEAVATAIETLARLSPRQALLSAYQALDSESDLVRYKGVQSLGIIGDRSMIRELGWVAVRDLAEGVRRAALDSAMAISARAAPTQSRT